MTALLDEKVIDFMERTREKTPKKDTVLQIKINVSYLKIHLKVGKYRVDIVPNTGDTQFVMLADSRTKDNGDKLKMLLPDNQFRDNRTFSSMVETVTFVRTIASSDWVNDFQVPLGVGKFLIVEIKQPDALVNGAELRRSNDGEKQLAKRLVDAQNRLQSVEKLLREGEWGKVVKESVELFEILKKDNISTIKQVISESTGITTDKAGQLTEALDKLYGYAADLHHPIDESTKGVKAPFTGGKEDAYLVYIISCSLINALSRKLS